MRSPCPDSKALDKQSPEKKKKSSSKEIEGPGPAASAGKMHLGMSALG